MEVLLLLFTLLNIHLSSAVPHTLWYRYTAVTSGGTFPEFTVVGLVDGEQFVYYDSNIRKMIPKTEWIKKIGTSYPQYWEQETQSMQDQQARFQNAMNTAMQSFRHTAGVHTLQRMYGCELYDNGTKRGHDQLGYDGEDLISLDMSSQTWTEASIRSRTFMNKWGSLGINPKFQKSYLEMECISWLKQYLGYSRDTLERKVPPEASFFQRDPSSPEVVCHATGFYPNPVDISWQKDGQVVHENVLLGETLPNGDGTFQKRIVLKVSAEELQKHNYTCVIQHSSLEKEMVLPFERFGNERGILKDVGLDVGSDVGADVGSDVGSDVRSDVGSDGGSDGGADGGADGGQIGTIVGVVVALAVLIAGFAGIVIWKKKNSRFRPVPPGSSL